MKHQRNLEQLSHLHRFAEYGKLSTGLLHDLINPLTAMSLYLNDIADNHKGRFPHAMQKKINTALHASIRMSEFVMSIRQRLAQEIDKKTFLLKDEIENVITLLSGRAKKEKITYTITCPDNLYLYGNPLCIYQVLLNIISNAMDAYQAITYDPPCRSIIINAHHHRSHQKHMMKLCITDYGVGIPKHLLKKIFEPFFTTKDRTIGSGIGLSTTKEIIEKDFSGTIDIRSTPGNGTTVTIHIPLAHVS